MHISFVISIFFTLFIVVDPLGLIPVFVIYLTRSDKAERKRIIFKTISVATIVSLLFIFLGRFILLYLGISPGAFLIAGGILLFIISIDLILARPSRTKLPRDEDDYDKEDISVFPLAIPMISGPGNIAALMMFSSQSEDKFYMLIVISVISIIIFAFTMFVMFMSVHFERILGKTGISVIQRIMGLVLSALAVQFILNGLQQAHVIMQ